MDKKSDKAKLTANDRKALSANLKICTDSHGEGCPKDMPEEKKSL